MAPQRYSHSGNAPDTALAGDIDAGALSFNVVDSTGYPTGQEGPGPFWVVIDPGLTSEEKMLVASRSSATFTIAANGRGLDGTTATSHKADAVVRHVYSAVEADDANLHVLSASGVHGVIGNVVGDSDAQVLSNKELTGPVLDQPDIGDYSSAQHNHDTGTGGGNIPTSAVSGLDAALAARVDLTTDQTAAGAKTFASLVAQSGSFTTSSALGQKLVLAADDTLKLYPDAYFPASGFLQQDGIPGLLRVSDSNHVTDVGTAGGSTDPTYAEVELRGSAPAGHAPGAVRAGYGIGAYVEVDGELIAPDGVYSTKMAPQFDATGVNTTTTQTGSNWVAGAGAVVFVAPPSGKVRIDVGGSVGAKAAMTYEVRAGGTIGSGTVFLAAEGERGVSNSTTTGALRQSMFSEVTGLTPGATYNVRTMVQSVDGASATAFYQKLTVTPLMG